MFLFIPEVKIIFDNTYLVMLMSDTLTLLVGRGECLSETGSSSSESMGTDLICATFGIPLELGEKDLQETYVLIKRRWKTVQFEFKF